MNLEKIGYSLAGLSIALGLGELFAGKRLARRMGVPEHSGIVRAYGARELATGAALLARPTASRNVWARVVGDLLDLATLAAAFRRPGARQAVLWGGVAFVATALLADTAAALAMGMEEEEASHSF